MQPWKWDPCEVTEGGRRCYHCDNCDVALQDATAAARGVTPAPVSSPPELGPATIECAQLVRVLLRAIDCAQDKSSDIVTKNSISGEMRAQGSSTRSQVPVFPPWPLAQWLAWGCVLWGWCGLCVSHRRCCGSAAHLARSQHAGSQLRAWCDQQKGGSKWSKDRRDLWLSEVLAARTSLVRRVTKLVTVPFVGPKSFDAFELTPEGHKQLREFDALEAAGEEAELWLPVSHGVGSSVV